MPNRLFVHSLFLARCVAAATLLSSSSVAGPVWAAPSEPASPEEPAALPHVQIGEVVARGTGCPAGTWEATRADDGAIELVFEDYTAVISFRRTQEVRACTISIRVEGQDGSLYLPHSLATEFGRTGGTNHYEHEIGWASSTSEARHHYDFTDEASLGLSRTQHLGALRSRCGEDEELRIETLLQNTRTELDDRMPTDEHGTGVARLRRLRVQLEARRCGDSDDAPGAAD